MEREKRREGGIVDREIANRENTARRSRHCNMACTTPAQCPGTRETPGVRQPG